MQDAYDTEYTRLENEAYLNALPSWIADRIRAGTLRTWPTFLSDPNGTNALREPYESRYQELMRDVKAKLKAKYFPPNPHV